MADASPRGLLAHVDELVMEYLLFRGFSKSFQAFQAERRRDRARGFDVDQILQQLLLAVQSYRVEAVLETWKFLSARFFHSLDASYSATLQKLETSLLRLYVVNAVKTGHREKAAEFFKRFANRLHESVPQRGADVGDSWARWFILPYIEHPETDPYFQVFFSKEWLEAFVASFRNFLGLVFRNLPLPTLLAFQLTRLQDPTLKMRLKVSQAECSRLRLLNLDAASKIKKLEEAGRQLHSVLRMMVQHSYLEHFTDSSVDVAAEDSPNGLGSSRGAPRSRIQSQDSRVGLTREQMRELGELFGITSREHETPAALFSPENDHYRSDQFMSEEERPSDDAFAVDSESGGPMSPPFSPLPGISNLAVLEPHAELSDDGSDNSHADSPSGTWTRKSIRSPQRGLKVSLIREMNLLNDWETNVSTMVMRSRFSQDGTYLAISQLGNSHVDIWRTEGAELSPVSTLSLDHPMKHLAWITTSDDEQALLCVLADHSISAWRIGSGELLSTLPPPTGARIGDLSYSTNGSSGLSLYEYDADGASSDRRQEVHVIHNHLEELECQSSVFQGSGELSCLSISDSGRVAAVGTVTGVVHFFETAIPNHVETWTPGGDYHDDRALAAICFSPDETSLFSIAEGGDEVLERTIAEFMSEKFPSESSTGARGSQLANSVAVCRYDIGSRAPDAQDDLTGVSIRFLGGGDFFVVSVSHRLHLFKRGQSHAVSVEMLNESTLADIDWHPRLPVCSSANQDGTVALWNIEEFSAV